MRDVPDWARMRGALTERNGEEYELAFSQLPLGIFGRSEFEVLRDKKHQTMVYPSSLNHRINFARHGFANESLTNLDVAPALDGKGTELVGKWTSFVNRRFVDGFVACMRDVYNVSWQNLHVWALGSFGPNPLPIFVVSEPLSISIAPHVYGEQSLEPAGKYQPLAGGQAGN